MRRIVSVLAVLLVASMLALVSRQQPHVPDLAQPSRITIEPSVAEDLVAAGAIKEVKCRPGFGHGIAYVLDGKRHCFKAVADPAISPADTTSPLGSGDG